MPTSLETPGDQSIYSQRLLDLAERLSRTERLTKPDASAWVRSRLCGSEVTVDLTLDGDVVSDYAHEVKACALGTAAATVMAEHVVGSHAAELRQVRDQLRAMLKQGEPPPDGRWTDLAALVPARQVKSRHPSILLAFDAVVKALDEIDAKGQGT